jgi:hypothetical protein
MFYVKDLVTKEVLLSDQSHDGLYAPYHCYCILLYTHTHTHIYIKGWLTIILSLLIILNLYKVKRFIYKEKGRLGCFIWFFDN